MILFSHFTIFFMTDQINIVIMSATEYFYWKFSNFYIYNR